MRIDVHCHVFQRSRPFQREDRFGFEPPEGYAPGDAYLSPRMTGGFTFPLLKWWLGLPPRIPDEQLDVELERFFLDEVLNARELDRVLVLAMDQYHTATGGALGPRLREREHGTDLYVSNTYARALWRRHSGRILFGASIHPYREHNGQTATAMLEEVAASGAVLIKWLPIAQNIDIRDPRTILFLRRAAELNMPMLIHYGGERILANHHDELEDPRPLLETLRELRREVAMPTVIVAHVATPMPFASTRGIDALTTALLGEFADAPLYADISALALPHRARWLKRFADRKELHSKLVYGSDFPLPPMPSAFRWRLGKEYARVKAARYWLDRDVLVKSGLGFAESVFERASVILKHRIDMADGLAGLLRH